MEEGSVQTVPIEPVLDLLLSAGSDGTDPTEPVMKRLTGLIPSQNKVQTILGQNQSHLLIGSRQNQNQAESLWNLQDSVVLFGSQKPSNC